MHHSLSFDSEDSVHISRLSPLFEKQIVAQKCPTVKISVVGRTATAFGV